MLATFLFVTEPVSALQLDVDTAADTTAILAPHLKDQKFLITGRVEGKLRLVIYSMDPSITFVGLFAELSGTAASISGVVGAAPDSSQVVCKVLKLGQPQNVKIS